MRWVYYTTQIAIVSGTVAFYEIVVFVDEPIQLVYALIIGAFLALIATAIIYWLTELFWQILALHFKQPTNAGRWKRRETGRKARSANKRSRSDSTARLI